MIAIYEWFEGSGLWKSILFVSSVQALALMIWFKTNAFVEYARLIGFGRFLKSFEEEEGIGISFPDYLAVQHNCFLTRLLSCAICLGAWLSVALLILHESIYILVVGYYLSLLFYFGLVWGDWQNA